MYETPMPVFRWLPIYTRELSLKHKLLLVVNPTRYFILHEAYNIFIEGYGSIYIPKDFITDLATIPRVLWGITKPDGILAIAALLHDYVYTNGYIYIDGVRVIMTRLEADLLFRSTVDQVNDIPSVTWLSYQSVRLFGRNKWPH